MPAGIRPEGPCRNRTRPAVAVEGGRRPPGNRCDPHQPTNHRLLAPDLALDHEPTTRGGQAQQEVDSIGAAGPNHLLQRVRVTGRLDHHVVLFEAARVRSNGHGGAIKVLEALGISVEHGYGYFA